MGKVYSFSSRRTHIGRCNTWAHWCADNDYELRWLREATTDMALEYLLDLEGLERSDNYRRSMLASLRKMEYLMLQRGWIKETFIPSDLTISAGPHRYGYRPDHALSIIACVAERDPEVALVLRVQMQAGLRLHEVTHLRTEFVDLEAGSVEVKGKGGKVRTARLLEPAVLDELPLNQRFVFSPETKFQRRVQARVRRACDELGIAPRGTHGFRATFAELRLERCAAQGAPEREARLELAKDLGHRRSEVTYAYVP